MKSKDQTVLGGVKKDYKEVGSGFVSANEFYDDEDHSDGDGKEEKKGQAAQNGDQPFEEYDDEDYHSHGNSDEGSARGGIAKKEDHIEEEHQGWSTKNHQEGIEKRQQEKLDGAEEIGGRQNPSREFLGRGRAEEEEENQDSHYDGSRQGWLGRVEEDEEGEGEDPFEEASGQEWSSRETDRKGEDHDTTEEAPGRGWSAEIFGGTVTLFAIVFLLIIAFVLCKRR